VSTHADWLAYIESHQYDPGEEQPISKL